MKNTFRRSVSVLLASAVFAAFCYSLLANQEFCGYELSEFVNCEALVVYQDGSWETLSCETQSELASALSAAVASDKVSFVQPNFEYTQAGELTTDEYVSEQWALYNDGNFEMVDEDNYFPVYDDPFGQPSAPGQWTNPWPQNRPGGMPGGWGGWASGSSSSSVTSVSGVDINVNRAWELYNGGVREAVIAIIDTGVDTEHEDFGDVFWVNDGEIADNGVDDDGNGYIDDVNGWDFYYGSNKVYTGSEDSHGTHGAGSIAATSDNSLGISGILSGSSARIMSLKALGGRNGSGTTASVIKAIQYAEENGAVICNMSMGTESYDSTLYQAMKASDMLFVVSSGNDGADTDKNASYPASFDLDNVVSVANLQADGTLHDSSNYGESSVDIAVPGTYILSLTTEDSYSYMTGTSMSAPIFSAAAAMLYSYCDELSVGDIKDILLNTATSLDVLDGKLLTGGMLNLSAAMEYVSENYDVSAKSGLSTLPFTDVNTSDFCYEAVKYLYENEIMLGTAETIFSPNSGLTRAMAITLLGRLAGAEEKYTDTFSDVSAGTWYSGYVGWAVDSGIVYGYGNGLFGTDDPVTAEQLDLILERYASLLGTAYDSGLSGNTALTRAETAQALYDFCTLLSVQ